MFAGPSALCDTEEEAEVSQDSSAKLASIAIVAVGISNQAPLVATPPLPQKVREAGRISRGGAGGPVQALLTHGSVNAAAWPVVAVARELIKMSRKITMSGAGVKLQGGDC